MEKWMLDSTKTIYVTWFDELESESFDYDEADLRISLGLKLVAELEDGAIFKVNRDCVLHSNP